MIANRNVIAWLLLVSSIAFHVFDEAMSDFLPFYNQLVTDLKENLGFFPAPTFSFGIWLGGLIGGIILCYSITPFVARGGMLIRVVSLVLGVLMVVNALLHLFTSVLFGMISPGMWSSPLLLAAALFVVYQAIKGDWGSKSLSG